MLVVIAILVLAVYIYLGFKEPAIALVTSPVVALTMVVIGEAESFGTVMIAPFIFFVTVIVVAIPRREPDSEQWPQRLAKWILIIFVFLNVFLFFFKFNYSLLPNIAKCDCYVRYLDDWFEYAAESAVTNGAGMRSGFTSRQPLNNPAKNTKMAGAGLLVE